MDDKKELTMSEEVLNQIKARTTALRGANVLFQMAEREYNMYIEAQLKGLGLDPKKKYNIDDKGVVSKLKAEPVKVDDGDVKIESAKEEN